MKLQLVSDPKEIFDAPRGVGLALIAAGTVQEYKPPVTPADTQVKWSIFGSADDLTRIPMLKAECPLCHNGITMQSVRSFVHCRGKHEMPPDDLAEKLNTLIRLRNKGTQERMEAMTQPPAKAPQWI